MARPGECRLGGASPGRALSDVGLDQPTVHRRCTVPAGSSSTGVVATAGARSGLRSLVLFAHIATERVGTSILYGPQVAVASPMQHVQGAAPRRTVAGRPFRSYEGGLARRSQRREW